MNDKMNNSEQLNLAPPAPGLQSDENSQWMEWGLAAKREADQGALQQVASALSNEDISVSFQVLNRGDIKLLVKQSSAGNYEALYLTSLRAILNLERALGPLEAIEGVARHKWDVNFVCVRQYNF